MVLSYTQVVTPFEQYFVLDEENPELYNEMRKGELYLGTVLGTEVAGLGSRTKEEVIEYYKERLVQLQHQGYYFDLPALEQRIIDYNVNLLDKTLSGESDALFIVFEKFYSEIEKGISTGKLKVNREFNSIDRFELESIFRRVSYHSDVVTSDFLPAIFYCWFLE